MPFLTRRDAVADMPTQTLGEMLTGVGGGQHFHVPPPVVVEKVRVERPPVKPRRGARGAYAGRSPVMLRDRVYRGTTAGAQGLYPWLNGVSLPPVGAQVGMDLHTGASFSYHPAEWIQHELIGNPNLVITGAPGVGKSALLKLLVLRLIPYGVRSFIAGDLKNEYAMLARALGEEPLELGPGFAARLNPLDSGDAGRNIPADPAAAREAVKLITERRLTLLKSLLEMRLRRSLTGTDERALSLVLADLTGQVAGSTHLVDPTLSHVWDRLRDPTPEMVHEMRITGYDGGDSGGAAQNLREAIRPMTDVLATLVFGPLAGIFDGPTTVRMNFDGPLQTVDLSRIEATGDDDMIAMTLACVSSWAQAKIDVPGGPPRMVVRDELWRQLRIPAMVAKIDADLRLSRKYGTIQLLATHALADFNAAGSADSAVVAMARGLVDNCDIKVVCPQAPRPLAMLGETMGLSAAEIATVSRWNSEANKGYGLWQIKGAGSHVVRTQLTALERKLFYTNERMVVA